MNQDRFIEELEKINIKINQQQIQQLHSYYELLIEWNQKINLTGITQENQVYLKHFFDSATLYKAIQLENIETLCDVGTGAGFPGIVLKILFPHLKVTLVDSLNKRIQFLNLVIHELGLNDITAIHARAEEFAHNHIEQFDIVTARAVAPLNILVEYCLPMVEKNGYFIPMKANLNDEIEKSKHAIHLLNGKIDHLLEFTLPVENSHRSLLSIKKVSSSPTKYPRKYAEIKKRPL